MPGRPKMKEIPGLGKAAVHNMVNVVKMMAAYTSIFVSFLKNGTRTKSNEIGILKYCAPPHDAFASPSIRPPTATFGIVIFSSFCLKEEINKYRDIRPKNSPRGSDLNHPRFPLWIIAGLNAKNNAENIPAVLLLLIALTRANIVIVDKDPIITGRMIVKSISETDLPNIL
jgi:hypothetical protein